MAINKMNIVAKDEWKIQYRNGIPKKSNFQK